MASSLVERLSKEEDETEVLFILMELCQILVMGDEESLSSFSSKNCIDVFTQLLKNSCNSEIMLHTTRGLLYIIDIMPKHLPLYNNLVPILLDKLKSIEYIDVAEQFLQLLHIISEKNGDSVLKQDGISTCLMYIDFFSISTQRLCLSIIRNSCINMSKKSYKYVKDHMPILVNRINSQDKKTIELVCECLFHIAESFRKDSNGVPGELANNNLFNNMQQLLLTSPRVVSSNTCVMILKMFGFITSKSPQHSQLLLKSGFQDTLKYLLEDSREKTNTNKNIQYFTNRNCNETQNIIILIGNLLPSLPVDGAYAILPCLPYTSPAYFRNRHKPYNNPFNNNNNNNNTEDNNINNYKNNNINNNVNSSIRISNNVHKHRLAFYAGRFHFYNHHSHHHHHHDHQVSHHHGNQHGGRRHSSESMLSYYWQWYEQGMWNNYDEHTAAIIEKAYTSKEKAVRVEPQEGDVIDIDFKLMMQLRLDDEEDDEEEEESRKVIRRVLKDTSDVALRPYAAQALRKFIERSSRSSPTDFNTTSGSLLDQETILLIRTFTPLIYDVYTSSANAGVKHTCLLTLLRITYVSDGQLLEEVFRDVQISSTIADMLSSKDPCTVAACILMSDLLMTKLPSVFGVFFNRQGVLHQMAQLAQVGLSYDKTFTYNSIKRHNNKPANNNNNCNSNNKIITYNSVNSTTNIFNTFTPNNNKNTRNNNNGNNNNNNNNKQKVAHSINNLNKTETTTQQNKATNSNSSLSINNYILQPSHTTSTTIRTTTVKTAITTTPRSTTKPTTPTNRDSLIQTKINEIFNRRTGAKFVTKSESQSQSSSRQMAANRRSQPSLSYHQSLPSVYWPRNIVGQRIAALSSSSRQPANQKQTPPSSTSSSVRNRILGGLREHSNKSKSFLDKLSSWKRSNHSVKKQENSKNKQELTVNDLTVKIEEWVINNASLFLDKHFKSNQGISHPALEQLCQSILSLGNLLCQDCTLLKKLSNLLLYNDISPFELSQSNFVDILTSYLTPIQPRLLNFDLNHDLINKGIDYNYANNNNSIWNYNTDQNMFAQLEDMNVGQVHLVSMNPVDPVYFDRLRLFLHVFYNCQKQEFILGSNCRDAYNAQKDDNGDGNNNNESNNENKNGESDPIKKNENKKNSKHFNNNDNNENNNNNNKDINSDNKTTSECLNTPALHSLISKLVTNVHHLEKFVVKSMEGLSEVKCCMRSSDNNVIRLKKDDSIKISLQAVSSSDGIDWKVAVAHVSAFSLVHALDAFIIKSTRHTCVSGSELLNLDDDEDGDEDDDDDDDDEEDEEEYEEFEDMVEDEYDVVCKASSSLDATDEGFAKQDNAGNKRRTYSSGSAKTRSPHKSLKLLSFQFYINQYLVPPGMVLYEALTQFGYNNNDNNSCNSCNSTCVNPYNDNNQFISMQHWFNDQQHTIFFKPVFSETSNRTLSSSSTTQLSPPLSPSSLPPSPLALQSTSSLSSLPQPPSLPSSSSSHPKPQSSSSAVNKKNIDNKACKKYSKNNTSDKNKTNVETTTAQQSTTIVAETSQQPTATASTTQKTEKTTTTAPIMIYKKKTALTIYKAHSHPLQQENNTTTQQKISLRHYVPFRFNNNTNNNNNNKNNRHMYQHKYQQVIFPSHLDVKYSNNIRTASAIVSDDPFVTSFNEALQDSKWGQQTFRAVEDVARVDDIGLGSDGAINGGGATMLYQQPSTGNNVVVRMDDGTSQNTALKTNTLKEFTVNSDTRNKSNTTPTHNSTINNSTTQNNIITTHTPTKPLIASLTRTMTMYTTHPSIPPRTSSLTPKSISLSTHSSIFQQTDRQQLYEDEGLPTEQPGSSPHNMEAKNPPKRLPVPTLQYHKFISEVTSASFPMIHLNDPSLPSLSLLSLIHSLSTNHHLLYKSLDNNPAIGGIVKDYFDNDNNNKNNKNDCIENNNNSNSNNNLNLHQNEDLSMLSNKLNSKVLKQLNEVLSLLSGTAPAWVNTLPLYCTFLFPFETRHLVFCLTCLDMERAILKYNELYNQGPSQRSRNIPMVVETSADLVSKIKCRIEKAKRQIDRKRLLEQAELTLSGVVGSAALLEVKYVNEVGFGLGPTLEFYTLVSKQLQLYRLNMWIGVSCRHNNNNNNNNKGKNNKGGDDDDDVYVLPPSSYLHPKPIPYYKKNNNNNGDEERVLELFEFLGRFMAKSLVDYRLVDLPLSPFLFKCLLPTNINTYHNNDNNNNNKNNNNKSTVTLHNYPSYTLEDLATIDLQLYNNLNKLQFVVNNKMFLEQCYMGVDRQQQIASLTLDGVPIEDLCLTFTLPGHPDIELIEGGSDLIVDISNLEEYIDRVVEMVLLKGCYRQIHAFRLGFESFLPLPSLRLFRSSELEKLFCGEKHEDWSVEFLMEVCQTDHGYTQHSTAIHFLYHTLAQFDMEWQRKFLQFITGSPRLPFGGLRHLKPPLTIVCRSVDDHPDMFLPSVMTCVNYLKLPNYTSQLVLKEKLQQAILEGQLSFHLS